MASVTVMGTGGMGQAIVALVERGGHTVQRLGHEDGDTAISGDLVVLAVPYAALDDIVTRRGDQLAGTVVVDISNPVDFQTFDSMVVPADSSAAAELAGRLPNSVVLKAFNTTFAATLAAGTVGGEGGVPTTVLVAGDDPAAKQALIDVVTSAGLRAKDAGGLARARELEALGFLQITLAAREQVSWAGGLAVLD